MGDHHDSSDEVDESVGDIRPLLEVEIFVDVTPV